MRFLEKLDRFISVCMLILFYSGAFAFIGYGMYAGITAILHSCGVIK